MRYAVVADGIVENVIEAESDFEIPGMVLVELQESQSAGPGDLWDGESITRPVITDSHNLQPAPFEFLALFTAAEIGAIFPRQYFNAIGEYQPNSLLIAALGKVQTIISFIDLQLPETQQLVGYVAQLGLIAPERVSQILSGTPPQKRPR